METTTTARIHSAFSATGSAPTRTARVSTASWDSSLTILSQSPAADQHLTNVAEHLNIAKEADGKVYGDNSVTGETHIELVANALCSMNMWGFTPDYFEKSGRIFESFLEANSKELKKEFYIPYAIDCMIKSGEAKTDVLSTPSHWFGVTYKEDRPAVVAKFQEFADNGVYPTPLYKK